jgi:hypothetical protein
VGKGLATNRVSFELRVRGCKETIVSEDGSEEKRCEILKERR